jgi:hypothetical protein
MRQGKTESVLHSPYFFNLFSGDDLVCGSMLIYITDEATLAALSIMIFFPKRKTS